MSKIRILGTGSFLPSNVLTNFDFQKMGLDTSEEWIVQRTGIRQRRIADPGTAASDLAYGASLKALEMAGIGSKEIDLIIMAPQIRKRLFCIVRHLFG